MTVKMMDIQEFWRGGYLQEVNRQFLHPLGLALSIEVDPDGNAYEIGGIWDCRNEKFGDEGFMFKDGMMDRERGLSVIEEQERRKPIRETGLGYWIQPLPEE